MATQRPEPRAEVRSIIALVLDEAYRSPERPAQRQVVCWLSELACAVGYPLTNGLPTTNHALLAELLDLRAQLDANAPAPKPGGPPARTRRRRIEPVVIDLERATAG